jgi:hypothetical protein
MSGFDLTIVILNACGASVAFGCNAWAAKYGARSMRGLRIGIAIYAAMYAVAYVWLATFRDVTAWSRIMRGVALGTWPMVWCAPAIMSAQAIKRIVHNIEQMDNR